MIDDGKWKDNEKNFDNIQGSLKDDGKMMIRFKSNCKDRRKKMERWLNVSLRFWKIDEGRWKDDEKIHSIILGSLKADGKISQKTKAITVDEGKWKDNEMNFDNNQGSLKDDEKMMIRF